MLRFRVRTLMIAVAIVALLLAAIGPGRQWYRRWSYHRAEAKRFAKFEAKERQNYEQERQRSENPEGIKSWLVNTQGFAGKSPQEIDRAVGQTVEYHKERAAQSLSAAKRWAVQRGDSETAAFWAFDPFAPNAP